MSGANRKRTGLAALAGSGQGDDFSVIDAIGGVRGVIESMLPGVLFVVVFVITANVRFTVIVAAALAAIQVLVRLVQRQQVAGALSGILSIAICLLWAWKSNQARDYYTFGFITNSVSVVVLSLSLVVRVPALGAVIEFLRSLPTEHFRSWLREWRDDRDLCRSYAQITALWVAVFLVRLAVQVPLYLTNHVTALGTARLLMGVPFWALAIWVSYLIVATPMHRHAARRAAAAPEGQNAAAPDADAQRSAKPDSTDAG